jgi:L-aspartate oxidase
MNNNRDSADSADFIVIGSGIAGLRAGLELAAHGSVVILTKDKVEDSNTELAQGGVAVVLSEEDRVGFHLNDTLQAGDGLCDEEMVRILVEEGPAHVTELIAWGTEFDREGLRLSFTREGAHSKRRILHAQGDSTGREIVRTLSNLARNTDRIRVIPKTFTVDLLLSGGRCLGVTYLGAGEDKPRRLLGRAVLMVTGGAGKVYLNNTNPPQATGDGMAIAFRAGAEMMDLEFVQFHPTALCLPGVPSFLLSESIRGEGGVLRNGDGKRFMVGHHPQAELAPRDVVSREILYELQRSGEDHVFLDLTRLRPDFIRKRFPTIHSTCARYGVDITRDSIPVTPSAHYFMGGIWTDAHGRTSIPGLYAAGEVACTGVHGANRLASNSLLEGLVFGARSARAILADRPPMPHADTLARITAVTALPSADLGGRFLGLGGNAPCIPEPLEEKALEEIRVATRKVMWDRVGIVRSGVGLTDALTTLRSLLDRKALKPLCRSGLETLNMLTVACLVARAAVIRTESRGSHYRSDYPKRNDRIWLHHSRLTQKDFTGFRLFP